MPILYSLFVFTKITRLPLMVSATAAQCVHLVSSYITWCVVCVCHRFLCWLYALIRVKCKADICLTYYLHGHPWVNIWSCFLSVEGVLKYYVIRLKEGVWGRETAKTVEIADFFSSVSLMGPESKRWSL